MLSLDFPLFPDQASTLAKDVDAIFFFGLGIAVIFSILIAALVIVFATRYKRRRVDEVGQKEQSPMWLELAWSIIPLFIMLFMFGWGMQVYFKSYRTPADAERYYVVGKQWMWKIQHPEGNREINTFHVPVNRPIEVVLTSEDVIHSFFIPAFRIKRDAVPGRYTSAWFTATETGEFDIYCAEYCGAEHSLMIGKVIVMEEHEYESWLAGTKPEQPLAMSGAQLFQQYNCHTCHREDSDARAPYLGGLDGSTVTLMDGSSVVADDAYIRSSIMNPGGQIVAGYQPIMPTYRGQIGEEQILELLSYIKSLPPREGAPGAESGEEER